MPVINRIAEFHDEIAAWRRDLHAHPETAFEEQRTSDIVAEKLSGWGMEVHRGLATTGVVGVLKGQGDNGRSIGLRADMDALHIQEKNDFPHRSVNDGKMHACGHDGHSAMLLGAAKYLAETRNFDGTVYFIFQPAEENEGGGRVMVEEGLFDKFPAEAVYGMHNLYAASESLMEWVLDPGEDYYELETHHLQLLTQWNRYAEHAAAAVGGSWTHHKRYGEEGWVYTPVEREYQLEAMAFIDEFVLQTPQWALDINQLRRLEHAGVVERVRAYQELAVQRLLNHARLARMIENEAFLGDDAYRPADMLDDAREMIWREMYAGDPIDTYRRNMQRAYLQQADYLLNEAESDFWSPPGSGNLRVGSNNDPPLNADLHIGQSDIRPLIRDQLTLLRDEVEEALTAGVDDRMTRIHLQDALVRIDAALGS